MRSDVCALVLCAAVCGFACANRSAIAPITSPVLASHRTLSELRGFLGTQRASCVDSRPGYALCGWQLSKRESAWKPLAESIGTRYRLNVLCEVPIDDAPRGSDSCYVFPRVALSYDSALKRAAPDLARSPSDVATRASEAARALASATTLFEVSRLVGAPPDRCLRRSQDRQLCRWVLSDQTPSHALIAAIIDEGGKVVLGCSFPYAGLPRDEDSCAVRLKQ